MPVVNIGSRQNGRDRGINVVDVDYDSKAIKNAINKFCKQDKLFKSDHIYGDGLAGLKIAEILEKTSPSVEKKLAY